MQKKAIVSFLVILTVCLTFALVPFSASAAAPKDFYQEDFDGAEMAVGELPLSNAGDAVYWVNTTYLKDTNRDTAQEKKEWQYSIEKDANGNQFLTMGAKTFGGTAQMRHSMRYEAIKQSYVEEFSVKYTPNGSTSNFTVGTGPDKQTILLKIESNGEVKVQDTEAIINDAKTNVMVDGKKLTLDLQYWYDFRIVVDYPSTGTPTYDLYYKPSSDTNYQNIGNYTFASQVSATDTTKLDYTLGMNRTQFAFQTYKSNTATPDARATLSVDNERVYPLTHDVSISMGRGGKVMDGASELKDGDKVAVADGADKTFTVIPDENYAIDMIYIDGQEMGDRSPVTIQSVKKETTLRVTFKVTRAVEPTWGATSEVYLAPYTPAGSSISYPSATVFSALNPGAGWEVIEFGVKIYNQAGLELPLVAHEALADGKYGVRVYGPGLNVGETYLLKPYAKITDGSQSKTITGSEKTFVLRIS